MCSLHPTVYPIPDVAPPRGEAVVPVPIRVMDPPSTSQLIPALTVSPAANAALKLCREAWVQKHLPTAVQLRLDQPFGNA